MYLYLALTLGLSWHFTQALLYGLLAILLLATGLSVGWIGTTLRRHVKQGDTTLKPTATPSMKHLATIAKAKATEISKPVGFLVLGLAMGLVVGWLWRDHQLKADYSREYSAWKERSASYQKAYALWAERQPREDK